MFRNIGWRKVALALAVLVCMMFAAAACAQAEESSWMRVVNCEEWVSLREKPDAGSACLAEVPLGALVKNCSAKTKTFTYVEYNGLGGYILTKYLEIVPQEQMQMIDQYVVDRGEWIAMRIEAEEEAPVIQWLAPGTQVETYADSTDGFVYGQRNGMKGYVRLEDIQAAQ